MVMDTRLFVSLNPFNVYIAQPSMRPGCVLRTNNWSILEQRNLVTSDQVRDCKNRMNTFGSRASWEVHQILIASTKSTAKNYYLINPEQSPAQETEFLGEYGNTMAQH